MSQRMERVAGEVRAVLGDVLTRDEIKDPRVRGAGLITVTHVRVSGDLRHARAFFTVHGLADEALERVRIGLDHASGYFRRAIAARLRTKVSPLVTFEVDRVFDQAERVERLLRQAGTGPGGSAPAGTATPEGEPDDQPDGQADGQADDERDDD